MNVSIISGVVQHVSVTGHIDILSQGGMGVSVLTNEVLFAGQDTTLFLVTGYDMNGVPTETWGYSNPHDRDMHKCLSSISGVSGAKSFAIICAMGVNGIVNAVECNDKGLFIKVKGIGTKMAETLMIELNKKLVAKLLPEVKSEKRGVNIIPLLFLENMQANLRALGVSLSIDHLRDKFMDILETKGIPNPETSITEYIEMTDKSVFIPMMLRSINA